MSSRERHATQPELLVGNETQASSGALQHFTLPGYIQRRTLRNREGLMPTSILDELLSEVPKNTLWHYTNQKGLLGIVQSQALWATHHQYLNDRTEFTLAQNLIRHEVNLRLATSPLAGIKESQENYLKTLIKHLELPFHGAFIFVCSFSEVANDLSQWRAYSRGSPGIFYRFFFRCSF